MVKKQVYFMQWLLSRLKGLLFISSVLPATLFANSDSVGDVAESLMGPAEIVTKLLLLTCYIVGFALIMVALTQYKIHRESPKLVPLTTPITLLILGLITVLIPYGTKMYGETYSAVEQRRGTYSKENLLPVPDTSNQGALLPIPSRYRDRNTQSESSDDLSTRDESDLDNPRSSDGLSQGAHWSNDIQ